MKPTELRLGNLLHDREGKLCRVEQLSFDADEFHAPVIEGALTCLPHKPIPIDQKILKALGFIKDDTDDDNVWYFLKFRTIEFSADESTNFNAVYCSIGKEQVECEFLHQLQNLYFALTGQELKLKNEI